MPGRFRLTLAQLNPVVGDLTGNLAKVAGGPCGGARGGQ